MRLTSLAAAALATAPLLATACSTMSAVQHKEDALVAAGFMDRPANTPERQAMLARLPSHKFVRRVHGERVSYVYADPTNCNCLYVGNQRAYGRYVRQQQRQNIADENALTAAQFNDPAWNWGAWGGFGPWFGYGPGFGW